MCHERASIAQTCYPFCIDMPSICYDRFWCHNKAPNPPYPCSRMRPQCAMPMQLMLYHVRKTYYQQRALASRSRFYRTNVLSLSARHATYMLCPLGGPYKYLYPPHHCSLIPSICFATIVKCIKRRRRTSPRNKNKA